MMVQRWSVGLLGVFFLSPLRAEEESWEYRLARAFSGRLAEIEAEVAEMVSELPGLPGVPVADQGGTGGFASLHPKAKPNEKGGYSIEVRSEVSGMVDLVALVPARRYEVSGLEAQFGMPDSFVVDLIDGEGKLVKRIAEERDLWLDPVRAGHPFVYEVEPAVEAVGLRVSAGRLRLDSDVSDSYVHAWAEAFMFEGEGNLARGATVTSSSGMAPAAPWQWSRGFLVDEQTPLGLPEIPAEEHRNIGWISNGRPKADQAAWLQVDLGEVRDFDAVRLFPAMRPTADLPSGFGFPRQLTISASDGRELREGTEPQARIEVELANPGNNPVYLPMEGSRGRFVKVEATKLWKAFENYPAFFALSEVEVLSGEEDLAFGAAVRSPDGMGNVIAPGSRVWSAASLTDGFGPQGKLVSRRSWLLALNGRLRIEEGVHRLGQESQTIVNGWRRAGLTAFALLGAGGAFVLIALPIRYRVKEKQQLVTVRERIAGDLHDEVGSNLGSIQMFADLAEGRSGGSEELKRIQRIAAETVSAVRDIVWLLRPGGDHRIGTVEHLRETSSIMLERLEWEFTANEEAWQGELSDEANRHLFLFFREALHNVLRHAEATRVAIRAEQEGGFFRLTVEDDGCGIGAERLARAATLRALRQRVAALDAEFKVESEAGKGTRLDLKVPLVPKRKKRGAKER